MGILTHLFRAATPENPRFSLNDPAAWDAFGDGAASSTGLSVSAEAALTYAPWFRGINLLATDTAKLPLRVYKGDTISSLSADKVHPAYRLILRRPNEYQTAFDFKRQLTGHAISRGNGYAYIERLGSGVPVALLPLDPAATSPRRENGRLWYVTRVGSQERKLPPEDVLHIKGFGTDGLQGYSVIDKAREQLGLGLAARKYDAIQFKNSGRPSIILQTDQVLNGEKTVKIRESWERQYTGIDNAHRTAVLDAGLKALPIGFNAEDSQFIERQKFNIIMVALFLGIPPHKLGEASRAAYNTLEQENLAYLSEGLDHWLIAWETECWQKLLTEEEQQDDSREIRFDRRAVIATDARTRAEVNRIALGGAPYKTVNEVRLEDNLPPRDGADELQQPANMGKPGGNPDFTKGGTAASAAPRAEFSEDQPRDDDGKFASGEGTPAHVKEQRDKEDEKTDAEDETEDDATQEQRDKEDEDLSKAEDKEDKDIEKGRRQEDREIDKGRRQEDRARERQYEREDHQRDAQKDQERDREYRQLDKRQEQEKRDAKTDEERQAAKERHEKEFKQTAERHKKEDEDYAKKKEKERHDAERPIREKRKQEDQDRQRKRLSEDEVRERDRLRKRKERDANRSAEDERVMQRRRERNAATDRRRAEEDKKRNAGQQGAAHRTPPRSPQLAAALRLSLADACRRVVRRIAVQAEKHARDGRKFCDWLGLFRGANLHPTLEITEPAEVAAAVFLGIQQIPGTLAAQLLTGLWERLDKVAGEATAAQLPAAVSEAMAAAEEHLPAAAVLDLFGE